MNFLEKDLENIVWEADNIKLREKNLPINGKKIRQLKIGNYGVCDILTYDREYLDFCETSPYLRITIYELKKEKIGISAFLQSLKYAKGVKAYMEEHKPNIDFTIDIVLCAKNIDLSGEFVYITDLIHSYQNFGFINNIDFYTFEYLIDGINFIRHSDYNLIHKGF